MIKDFFIGIRAYFAYIFLAPGDVKKTSCQGCKTWEFEDGKVRF